MSMNNLPLRHLKQTALGGEKVGGRFKQSERTEITFDSDTDAATPVQEPDMETRRTFLLSGDYGKALYAATLPDLPAEHIRDYAKQRRYHVEFPVGVDRYVFAHPNTPPEVLETLQNSRSPKIREIAIENPSSSDAFLLSIANDNDLDRSERDSARSEIDRRRRENNIGGDGKPSVYGNWVEGRPLIFKQTAPSHDIVIGAYAVDGHKILTHEGVPFDDMVRWCNIDLEENTDYLSLKEEELLKRRDYPRKRLERLLASSDIYTRRLAVESPAATADDWQAYLHSSRQSDHRIVCLRSRHITADDVRDLAKRASAEFYAAALECPQTPADVLENIETMGDNAKWGHPLHNVKDRAIRHPNYSAEKLMERGEWAVLAGQNIAKLNQK